MARPNDPRIDFAVAPGEKLVECPYDSSHVILQDRMTRHITLCRRNHKKLKGELTKVQCIYNPHHFVYEKELAYHYGNCDYRKNRSFKEEYDAVKRYAPKRNESDTADKPAGCEDDEDWGEELNAERISAPKSYPALPKAGRVSFYVPSNMSQAARKEYRKALSARNREIPDKTFVRYQPIQEADFEGEADSGVDDVPAESESHVPDESEEENDHGEDSIEDQQQNAPVDLFTQGEGLESNAFDSASFVEGESKPVIADRANEGGERAPKNPEANISNAQKNDDEDVTSETCFKIGETEDGPATDRVGQK